MKRCLAALISLGFLACSSSTPSGIADRMNRPLFVGTDRIDRRLTYVLDASRSAVFAWDGSTRDYVTGRAPGPRTPSGYIAIPLGTDSLLDTGDTVFKGFAVAPTGAALAALYSFGFEDRKSHLTLVRLSEFPVDPINNSGFEMAADAVGPFAAPGARFVVVEPVSPTRAGWTTYPNPISRAAGPNVTRMAWTRRGDVVYGADSVNERVHVLRWPSLEAVTSVAVTGRPLDLALHPRTDRLAVITSDRLWLYGPAPTFAVERSVAQASMPFRVAFSQSFAGELVGVLNQNTTLAFYETATLCGVDADAEGFSVTDLTFLDVGPFSDADLSAVSAVGCASAVPDQLWRVIFGGQLQSGSARLISPTAVSAATFRAGLIAPGDLVFVGRAASTVTAVTETALFFAPLTAPPAAGAVTFAVYAANDWVVSGALAGLVGRLKTGGAFKNQIAFTVSVGAAKPTRGDMFVFTSASGFSPIFLGGVPSDMAEDRFGRFVVAIPQNKEARAVNVERVEDAWVIRTLYVIP